MLQKHIIRNRLVVVVVESIFIAVAINAHVRLVSLDVAGQN